MPAESAPQERVWMAWPSAGYTLGDSAAEADLARRTWAAVANAVAEFEPVSMLVVAADEALARGFLSAEVTLHEAALDDAWMRDIGPTFVLSPDGGLGAVDWVFNGWGQQSWARWSHDAAVGAAVASLAGAQVITSPLVNEGGAIHVDGEGTVLVTETVQLDPFRNPGMSKADVEAELARTLGSASVVWLTRGLTRDYGEFGTRGHVDMVATLPSPGTLLLHWQDDPGHPDAQVCVELDRFLVDLPVDVVHLPAPRTLVDLQGPVDWNYVNHLVVNDGVVACTFDDPRDDQALGLLGEAYPGRKVVGVDARPLFARGGGIHCITQQQPRTHA
ncbi:MAG TPA: agmatine deiminase family protein [Dermatophilaceae bacterium]|nr:agmatine deiminase family protein [Dermatophilaceae bacterium]